MTAKKGKKRRKPDIRKLKTKPEQTTPPDITPKVNKQIMDKKLPMVRLPLITRLFGKKLLRAKLGQGHIIGEIILPNRATKYLLVDLRANSFKQQITKERDKLFYLGPLKETPESYIRSVGGFQFATFDWESGLPVPLTYDYKTDFDDGYFADVVMNASLVAGTAEMMNIIRDLKNFSTINTVTMITSSLTFGLLVLQWLGIM